MKKRIHVNQHNIRANKKGSKLPVITVKTYKSNTYGNIVEILGPAKIIYSECNPLSCGAHVYLETQADVRIDGKLLE